MARSICERIRNVKSSLENAEQSFRENNGMRGELDLMLAEAEIKHLREKSDRSFIWNRQCLALFAAVVMFLAGYGGWLYAGMAEEGATTLKELPAVAAVAASAELPEKLPQTEAVQENAVPAFTDKPIQEQQTVAVPMYPVAEVKEQQRSVELPTADMRQLVRDARRTLRDAN